MDVSRAGLPRSLDANTEVDFEDNDTWPNATRDSTRPSLWWLCHLLGWPASTLLSYAINYITKFDSWLVGIIYPKLLLAATVAGKSLVFRLGRRLAGPTAGPHCASQRCSGHESGESSTDS